MVEVTQADDLAAAKAMGRRSVEDATDYRNTDAEDRQFKELRRLFAAHRLSAYAPDKVTPEVVRAAVGSYEKTCGEHAWHKGMEAALLAAFAVLRGDDNAS